MSSTQSSVFGTFRLINLHVRRRHLPFWPGLWLLRTACAITCNILRKKSVQLSGTQRLHCNVCLWQKSKPKDSRAPVETVISGVKREGGEERGERRRRRILFEPSDICYIMTCTMETCWERKWRGIVKEWEELFSEREREAALCVVSADWVCWTFVGSSISCSSSLKNVYVGCITSFLSLRKLIIFPRAHRWIQSVSWASLICYCSSPWNWTGR